MSLNKVTLIGRLTKDAELRRTANGTPVANFTLAVNRDLGKDDNGVDFIGCVVWNKTAENIERYCPKGSLIAVEGALRQNTWQDKNGHNCSKLEVLCNMVQFLDTRVGQNNDRREDNYTNPDKYSNHGKNVPGTQFGDYDGVFKGGSLDDIDTYDIPDDEIQF